MSFDIKDIKVKLKDNSDIKYRDIICCNEMVTLVYVDNLCDSNYISEYIIKPLLNNQKNITEIDEIKKEIIQATSVEDVDTLEDAITNILSANVIIYFSSLKKTIYCDVKGFSKRSVDIPPSETVIKGSREGFTENIQDNISAIRRRIRTSDFKIEYFKLGSQSQTDIALLYIEGTTPSKLINYIREKINMINNKNFIFYINNLEEVLKCKGTSFDTIGYTEKPDVAVAKLSEGRVVVIFDGTTFAITAPYFFIENFQTTDDYTLNKFIANTGRGLRWAAFLLSTLLPGFYLAIVTYHFKLMPAIFLYRMAIFRAGVPVPTVIELLYMMIFFQIIREAGFRLPQPIGPTLSIVGALILGDAAVSSGFASQVTVVVVAIASISSYLIPKLYISIFIWNTILILFASFLGLPGYFMGFVVFVSHLSNLTTCGYPYLYPLGTLTSFKYKDVIFRGDLSEISYNILIKEEKK
ncbi:MAG: spore germination protein [Eubacteriaceae bacterium]